MLVRRSTRRKIEIFLTASFSTELRPSTFRSWLQRLSMTGRDELARYLASYFDALSFQIRSNTGVSPPYDADQLAYVERVRNCV